MYIFYLLSDETLVGRTRESQFGCRPAGRIIDLIHGLMRLKIRLGAFGPLIRDWVTIRRLLGV